MDRLLKHPMSLVLALMSTVGMLLIVSGCNVMATAMYVLEGTSTPAAFKELKGKRVAIVCRPITALHFRDSSVSHDLAKQLSLLLEKEIAKIHIIHQREVFEWADENNWEDYVEIGKAVDAEYVIGLDLEEFSLYNGSTLYQGKANVKIMVYDVAKGKEPVFERNLPQTIYPPNSPIPVGEKPEAQFRRQFVNELAAKIARYFHDHDATTDFASDSKALVN